MKPVLTRLIKPGSVPLLKLAGVLMALTANLGFAENPQTTSQKQIDATVWKVFQRAFEEMDGNALNSVYAESVLRVTPEGIDTQGQFKQTNKTRFAGNIENGDQIALDFWFDSRQTSNDTSYDVGFYRMAITSPAGTTESFFGQFHIVLEKINDQWKIVQDWDTASIGGRLITKEDFDRGVPVQF